MSRRTRTVLAAAGLAGLLLLLLWVRRGGEAITDSGGTGEVAAGGARDEAAAPPWQDERASTAGKRLHTFRQGARTAVPTFAASLPPAFDAGATRHPRRLDRGGGGPADKRPGAARPGAAALKKALSDKLDRALESAEGCLDAWAEQDDSLDSGVMLAFSLDASGLEQVWIKDREGVPGGPLACIANSVYPIDWSGLTTEPIEVTVPVRYEPRDSG